MKNLKSIEQKYFEIEVDEIEKETAEEKVNENVKLLVNEIIEDYKINKFNEIVSNCFPGSNCDRDIATALEKMQFKINGLQKKLNCQNLI